ncbi:hypothetical protein ACIRD6_33200 [Streptomyces sp. NPDC102473]|uniref:hypothetical protein n=1 Tax=Streptomyces sp. NPDC102473 TaxID=3366180 RepID=UPI0038048598
MSLLPNISKETVFDLRVHDAKVEYEGETLELDFRGKIRQVVVPFPDEPADRVQLWIRDGEFELSGSGNGLYVAFGEGEHDRDKPSWVRVVQESPPKLEQRDVIKFAVAFTKEGGDRVELVTKNPMVMIGDLDKYPPRRGDEVKYRLEAPVELTTRDDTDTVVGRISSFSYEKGDMF